MKKQSRFTNAEKVFWPEEGYTKADMIAYYDKMAEYILPFLKDRPESLLRNPNGIKSPGFFQKNITETVPDFVKTVKLKSEHSDYINYLVCNNKETLLFLANWGCIELNPWNSRWQKPDKPDIMIIDLDPVERSFEDVVNVAKVAKHVLDIVSKESFCKTSGKRGLHIVVPIKANYDYESIRIFSELLVRIINVKIPEVTSLERLPSKRRGKVYLDWLQNRRGQTLAAPYSLRPVKGATVSTPLEWQELNAHLDPREFTMKTIWKRLSKKGNIWRDLFKKPIDLAQAIDCLKEQLKRGI